MKVFDTWVTVKSWKLKWAILITSCLASVRPSVQLSVRPFHIFIFFSRTTGPISTILISRHDISFKLGTKHVWVMGIQVCSNEGPHPFPRGDNYKIAKIHWQNLKIFYFRTTGPISTKLSIKHPYVMWIQVCSNEGPCHFPREDYYELAKIRWQNFKNFFTEAT